MAKDFLAGAKQIIVVAQEAARKAVQDRKDLRQRELDRFKGRLSMAVGVIENICREFQANLSTSDYSTTVEEQVEFSHEDQIEWLRKRVVFQSKVPTRAAFSGSSYAANGGPVFTVVITLTNSHIELSAETNKQIFGLEDTEAILLPLPESEKIQLTGGSADRIVAFLENTLAHQIHHYK